MSIISLIAALDEANGIGKNNQLLCHLPADLKHFKSLTLNKPIIMGRKTWESIGKPLANRRNIIVSHTLPENNCIEIVRSLQQAIDLVQQAPEIMIIGGSSLYSQALPLATYFYFTRIHHEFHADTFFPVIDWLQWKLIDVMHYAADNNNPYAYSFYSYQRATAIL